MVMHEGERPNAPDPSFFLDWLGVPIPGVVHPASLRIIEHYRAQGNNLGASVARYIIQEGQAVNSLHNTGRSFEDMTDEEVRTRYTIAVTIAFYADPALSLLDAQAIMRTGSPEDLSILSIEDTERVRSGERRLLDVLQTQMPDVDVEVAKVVGEAEAEVNRPALGGLLGTCKTPGEFIDRFVEQRLYHEENELLRAALERGRRRFHTLYETAERVL